MAEQLNRTVLEMTRSMLFDTELPRAFWTFAVNYSQEILNRLPTRALSEDITPFELFYQKKPSVVHLRVFGCPVYVHIPDDKQGKLNPKAVGGFFMGMSQNKKTYLVSDT